MTNIIPWPTAAHRDLDVRPFAYALERMHPDLWATTLPAETVEQALARMDAANDVLDDLLDEAAAELAAEAVAA